MAISTKSSLNSLFDTIKEDTLFVAREMNIMLGLVTNYSATGWMQRIIPQWASLSAEAVAEGVDYANAQEFSKSALATLTPSEVMAQVILTDVMIETDPEDTVRAASTELGNAMAYKIDADIAATFTSFATDKGDGAGTAASIENFAVAHSYLRNQKTPNPIYAVVHPYGWHDIWVELGQPGANQALLGDVANEALRNFYVGRWVNMTWFVNANIAIDASTDAVGACYNPQAIAFDARKAPTLEIERDASLRAWELNLVAGYATGIRRDVFGVKFTHDATEPS